KFYTQIVKDRQRFLDAVGEARRAAKDAVKGKRDNTWAAYQCYGDPDWAFRSTSSDAQAPTSAADEYAGIASPDDLVVALKTLVIETEFRKAPLEHQVKKLKYLETRFGQVWRHNGAVAEAFGKAYVATKQVASAILWYTEALAAEDGGASIKTAEQLGNLRV